MTLIPPIDSIEAVSELLGKHQLPPEAIAFILAQHEEIVRLKSATKVTVVAPFTPVAPVVDLPPVAPKRWPLSPDVGPNMVMVYGAPPLDPNGPRWGLDEGDLTTGSRLSTLLGDK